jgi:hypothetical protein
MVYKHAISTVVPARMVKVPNPGQSEAAESTEVDEESDALDAV